MRCPDCSTYAESNFCPQCGRNLQNCSSCKKQQEKIYLGSTQISPRQFKQLEQQIAAGEKLEAIKQIRLWAKMGLADAKFIADHFHSIDFSIPQASPHRRSPLDKPSSQNKAAKVATKIGKGAGLVACFGCYGLFQIVAGLVKPFMGKQK